MPIFKSSCVAAALLCLTGCTPNQEQSNPPDETTPIFDQQGNQLIPDKSGMVAFILTSYSSTSSNRVRRLPGDETPVLYLTEGDDQQPFASTGRGNFYASCEEYRFDYTYNADANSGRNRLELTQVERVLLEDTFGCTSSTAPYSVDAATISLPVFSQGSSLLSDQPESQLVVYGENSEWLTFQLADAMPADSSTLQLSSSDWILSAYRTGANSLIPALTDNPLSIRFTEDGQLLGTSPCHTISGEYEELENRIDFNNVWLSSNNCALESNTGINLNAVDRQIQLLGSALQGPANTVFEDNRLYLAKGEFALVLTGRALAENETRLDMSTLASGEYPLTNNFDDAINQPAIQLIQQQTELNGLWNIPLGNGNTLGTPPIIDFERSVVLYLRMGFRPHLGESMTVRSASINDDHILIEVNTSFSDYDDPILSLCAYADAIAHPFSFIVIESDSVTNKEINVVEHRTSACSGLVEDDG